MNSFQTFVDVYNNYPKLAPGALLDTTTGLPTNSSMQNAISSNTNPNQRLFNTVPWMWKVNYTDSATPNIYQLDVVSNAITTINQGNIIQLENFNLGIQVYDNTVLESPSATPNATPYNMISINDFGAVFSSANLICYPSKGSVFANFNFTTGATDAVVYFPGYGVTSYSTSNGVTSVNVSYGQVSQVNFDQYINPDYQQGDTIISVTGSFYNGYVPSILDNEQITVNYTVKGDDSIGFYQFTLQTLQIISLGYTVTFDLTTTTQTIAVTPSPSGSDVVTPAIQNISPNMQYTLTVTYVISGISYNINAQFNIPTPYQGIYPVPPDCLVIAVKTVNAASTYLIYGPTLQQGDPGNQTYNSPNVFFATGYQGILQIAMQDPSLTIEDYTPYFGSYIISIDVNTYQSNGSFNMTVTNGDIPNSNALYLLPNHWNTYNSISGMTALTSIPTIPNVMYGNLTYYEITGNISLSSSLSVPLELITKSVDCMSTTQIDLDIKLNGGEDGSTVTLNGPYQYGQNTFTLVRLFLYAQKLMYTSMYPDVLTAVYTASMKYMTDTNFLNSTKGSPSSPGGAPPYNNMFLLQNEPYWKGIIVPADYLNLNNPSFYDLSQFGNSYYNDHHLQYGYMFYTLNALYALGQDIITPYVNNIVSILRDVVNPTTTTSGYKTRHKDWYSGFSFATGMQPANPDPSTYTGPIQRQLESCSEAINCYYSAYLLATTISALTGITAPQVIPVDINDIINAAAVCLDTEIKAIQQYYYCLAPGARLGLFTQVGGVGIMLNDGKTATLDFGVQPDSHNGRMLGIYGIQCLPFTDIAFQQIDLSWVNYIASDTIGSMGSFQMDSNLVLSLSNEMYVPKLYTNEIILTSFDQTTQNFYWSTVGAKILCFGDGSLFTDTQAQDFYSILQNTQNSKAPAAYLKQFDSVSHTWYFFNAFSKFGICCLLKGSKVMTDNGPINVEHLRKGDYVMTLQNNHKDKIVPKEVEWVGIMNEIDTEKNVIAYPIRIKKSAISHNVPYDDLLVSPLHGIYFDDIIDKNNKKGVIIRAKYLINHTTIYQDESFKTINYYHIKFDKHSIMNTQGLYTESYGDCDRYNRTNFINGDEIESDPVIDVYQVDSFDKVRDSLVTVVLDDPKQIKIYKHAIANGKINYNF